MKAKNGGRKVAADGVTGSQTGCRAGESLNLKLVVIIWLQWCVFSEHQMCSDVYKPGLNKKSS